jgi:succinate-acetate transporter protein
MSLIVFFMYTSFYVLDVLCPRCMVTWFVTVPVFLGVTFYNLTVGNWSANARVRRFGGRLLNWVPLVTLAVYLLAAVLAQLEMDFLHRL